MSVQSKPLFSLAESFTAAAPPDISSRKAMAESSPSAETPTSMPEVASGAPAASGEGFTQKPMVSPPRSPGFSSFLFAENARSIVEPR